MGTVNPNDEPEDQRAAIGPSVTDPEDPIGQPPEPQEDEDGDAEPKKKGGVKK